MGSVGAITSIPTEGNSLQTRKEKHLVDEDNVPMKEMIRGRRRHLSYLAFRRRYNRVTGYRRNRPFVWDRDPNLLSNEWIVNWINTFNEYELKRARKGTRRCVDTSERLYNRARRREERQCPGPEESRYRKKVEKPRKIGSHCWRTVEVWKFGGTHKRTYATKAAARSAAAAKMTQYYISSVTVEEFVDKKWIVR